MQQVYIECNSAAATKKMSVSESDHSVNPSIASESDHSVNPSK